jgi:hypothetical protein
MKRIVLIFPLLMLLSGCTVEYNLEINDQLINENIAISNSVTNVDENYYDNHIHDIYSENSRRKVAKYTGTKIKNNGIVTYSLNQKYNLLDNNYIRAFDECFDAYNILYTNESKEEFILQTSKGFNCMSYEYQKVDSYKINITTNHEVVNHNADSANDNTYTWNIDDSNYQDKFISIQFKSNNNRDKDKKQDKQENIDKKSKNKNNNYIALIILGIILIGFVIAILYAITLNTKRNKL